MYKRQGFPNVKPDTQTVISCYSDAVTCNLECAAEASNFIEVHLQPALQTGLGTYQTTCANNCAKAAYASCAKRVAVAVTTHYIHHHEPRWCGCAPHLHRG